MNVSRVFFLTLIASLAFGTSFSYAQQMQSGSYRIQFDSVNGGGTLSTSSSYLLEDTVGEVGTGRSNSANYALSVAGYQQGDSYLAISAPSDLTLPAITGLGGEETSGTVAWNVITDNTAGYSLYIQSSTDPALKSSSSSFSDYPISSAPDFNFTVPAASSTFGFSPEGSDIVSRYKDNGSVCNAGSSDSTDHCYDGLRTSTILIGQAGIPNSSSGGATTTVRFKAGVGTGKIQDSGTYTATVTVTALAL